MGMFDSVRCLYKQMPEEHRQRIYQTKDLSSGLNEYLIDEDGKLFVCEFTHEYDGRTENYETQMLDKRECKDITDTFTFYDYEDDKEYVYKVQYTEGKLTYFKDLTGVDE